MLIGLTHVALAVTNIDRALEFYKNIPGIDEKFRISGEDGAVHLVYLQAGPRLFIELFGGAKSPYQATTHAGPVHFCLEVDDIQSMYRQLIERGIVPNGEPKMGGDRAWQFWINDPDGNPVEFHQFTGESMQFG